MPGDCLALFGPDRRTSRPYSLCSGTDEPVIRFLVRRIPGGQVSDWLGGRQPGDEVAMSPPFGWFRPARLGPGERAVYLATGTGIAPFLAALRSPGTPTPAALGWGVRRMADLSARAELTGVEPLWLTVSREAPEPGVQAGRITQFLDRLPRADTVHYFLCGLDAMIDETTDWLEARGVPLARIHRECFFNADA